MKPSRRDLLKGLGAAGLVASCKGQEDDRTDRDPLAQQSPDRLEEPGAWDPGGTENPALFRYGVHAGDAWATGVLLSVRTDEPGCEIVVVAQDGDAWVEVQRLGPLDPVGAAIQVSVENLQSDTAHRYVCFASNGLARSVVGRFRTALASDSSARKLVIGATSCWGGSNPLMENLAVAAEDQLDTMLLLGDTVYADGSITLDDYRDEWDRKFLNDSVAALFASTSVIATWDDHEVDNNWVLGQTVTPEQYDVAVEAFREAIPMGVGPAGSGFWRSVQYGSVAEIFVLDSRGERGPNVICSDEQLDWMTEAIRASTATFKLVLCSVHLTDHSQVLGGVEAEDRWQGYPDQRDRLVRACEETPGTIVITGDMHYSAVQKLGRAGEAGEDVVELAAGPAGSFLAPIGQIIALAAEDTPQYVWMGETWTVTRLTLDPGTGEALAEFLDDEGTIVGSWAWTP